ncbi:MAG: hypothetical protein M1834_006538 [Cirrosporium novae-zelandiae]|nr:MAG: hypothetical protein M1834_006538 [Cirrosporium novae-zelandiae]
MKLLLLLSSLVSLTSAALWLPNQQRPLDKPSHVPPHSDELPLAPPKLPNHHLLALHAKLCEIESISGNEAGVGHYLAAYLKKKLNLTVELQPVHPKPSLFNLKHGISVKPSKRFNVLAYPGTTRQTRALLSSHIDTVPPYLHYRRTPSGEIWGRGSVDAKGSVAAQVTALHDLLSSGEISEGDVGLLFVVGEETVGDGMTAANDLGIPWETVIFGEPTDKKLACGHKGMLGFTIHTYGKTGHSGYPWLAVSANELLIKALVALQKVEFPASEKYGETTVNIGRISGGVAANVIPEKGEAKIAVRLAGGNVEDVKRKVVEAVESVGEGMVEVEFTMTGYEPVDIDCDVDGFDTITVNYGTDIPHLKGNYKRYLYGPGDILVAHSDHEHLTVGDLEEAVEGYKGLVRASLK